jgi:uncharacterized protein with GYD domain
MSTNSQSVNPVQDLLDRINEIQRRLEDLGPSVHNDRVQGQFDHVRTKIADARTAVIGLVNIFDRYSAS